MIKSKYFDAGFKAGKYYFSVAMIGWTLLVLILALIFARLAMRDYFDEAKAQARAAIERDLSYRAWCSQHGGVYVPVTEETLPDPYLNHNERDVTTTDGKQLTLIAPAAMTNEVHHKEQDTSEFLVSHLVSDKPLSQTNACDAWEAKSYHQLYHRAAEEIAEIVEVNHEPHVRMIRPLLVSTDCMACHAQHGYEVGDIRGAISVTLPIRKLLDRKYAIVQQVIIGYTAIWLIGMTGLVLGWRRMKRYDAMQTQTIKTLRRKENALQRAKIEAEDANETKTLFLANMSHEIRTPMSAILGFSDLMYHKELVEEERGRYIGIIRNNARLLLDIINDLLDMTKIESGKIQLEAIPVSPCQVCEDVVSLMRVRANEKNIGMESVYHFPIPDSIITDLARLRQILINLVGNAIKFTTQGKVAVEVRFRESNGLYHLEYTVRDTGIGMTEEQMERLFEPFMQADSSINRNFGGTGLGLVISQKFAHLLDGKIDVTSTPGVGSAFTLTIPVLPAEGFRWIEKREEQELSENVRKNESVFQKEIPKRPGKRVLLAEDGIDNQQLFTILLKKMEVDWELAENGQQAVETALRSRETGRMFDLILMDMQMPLMDGYTAMRTLRDNGWNGKIVALTAYAMKGDLERCKEAGANSYICKPVNIGEFILQVAEILGNEFPDSPSPDFQIPLELGTIVTLGAFGTSSE
ncbi:MAG: response regulator [Planctomycetaceae bacterium]|jgi:signal transduction histidine kinase/ActR/RegA family two-component response regulator|nr:response regulator [Planctomycetaceae bacterium]